MAFFALKLKSLHNSKVVSTCNPDSFIRVLTTEEQIKGALQSIQGNSVTYKVWKRVKINFEKKTNDGKVSSFVKERMKIVQETKTKENFIEDFLIEIKEFPDHVKRIQTQYRALKNLKENLTADEAIIQMDFAENYECQTQEEIQSAYWDKTAITLHPVVAFFKKNGSLDHKSIVSISDDQRHNADAVFAFMKVYC